MKKKKSTTSNDPLLNALLSMNNSMSYSLGSPTPNINSSLPPDFRPKIGNVVVCAGKDLGNPLAMPDEFAPVGMKGRVEFFKASLNKNCIHIRWDNGNDSWFGPKGIAANDIRDTGKTKAKEPKKVDLKVLESLVIDPEVKSEIVAVIKQHDNKKTIMEDWGLGKVIEYGHGTTMMFWGPPGTGKTYAATLIAKSLGMEILTIGAAEIQTQEPGGANRNIQNAFRTAKEGGMVLFIDECDSLIFNRNALGMILGSEVNTLLTEIEKSESIIILATNRVSDMDAALERRLSIIVEFPEPDLEQRKSIWKGLLPEKMPLGEDVNVEDLAQVKLTGGLIKNAVLHAARIAVAEEKNKVSKDHFDRAIKRIKSSQGVMGRKRIQGGDNVDRGASVTKMLSDYQP